MKRFLLIITIIICYNFTNAQNPFEAYGYTPKIATLSNGKYNEFHDLDTIVQIGTVLFNTQTKQIVAFLQVDTLYSEATLQPDIVSMWMSPDPLASEYPSNSPYMYCLGNPIVFVDPDGRFVDWYKSEAGNVIWQPGSADKINVGGEDFRNIGTTYTKNQMGNNYHYVQDNLVGITNNNTSFGEYLQNDKAYKNAISVANTQSNQTVKDVYMARFNQGLSEAHAGTLQLMGSIIGAVLTVETAVSIYIGVEGLIAAGGSTLAKNSINSIDDLMAIGSKLPKVKGGRQISVKGNIDDIFNSLSKGGKVKNLNGGKVQTTLPDGTTLTRYPAGSGSPTIQINQGGKIIKVRFE
jgi:hypothetical protein